MLEKILTLPFAPSIAVFAEIKPSSEEFNHFIFNSPNLV